MNLPSEYVLQLRHTAAQAIRSFFYTRKFWEVDTPVRLPAPAPELHIVAEPAGEQYLRTSPELHMKRMLATGARNIFQLGPCFRAQEYGSRHRPEFMMLEWYRRDADYMIILQDMQDLISHVIDTVSSQTGLSPHFDPSIPWEIHTIQDIYRERAGWDPIFTFDPDRFDLDMINIIEPSLPPGHCSILMDYPSPVAALARRKPDNPLVAERWELYAGGLELANAFSELTDPVEQRERFEKALEEKRMRGEVAYPLDEAFLAVLEDDGLPPCAGVALGFDRLLMALTGVEDIACVLSFPH